MSYLTAAQVRERFGRISDMSLWRWVHDERLGFPKPLMINRRRYFSADEIDAFAKRLVQAPVTEGAD